MESLVSFIQEWGYLAVFLGSLIEGESIILTASALAYSGHLVLWKIMILAFLGTWIADQALYLVGYKYGKKVIERFPFLTKSTDRAFELLKKWDVWFIIACRFIYGVRTTSSLVIGAAHIPPKRFFPLNILSAIIWVLISCFGGYCLGPITLTIFENFEKAQKYIIFLVIACLGLFVLKKWKGKNFLRFFRFKNSPQDSKE